MVNPTTILLPSECFAAPSDRECVMRLLKPAGVLGAFTVFAIVYGSVPEVDPVLRNGQFPCLSAKLLKRDEPQATSEPDAPAGAAILRPLRWLLHQP
jgi:hypothetical protein